MTYIEQVSPPYINDKLTAQRIRDDFETDPLLARNKERLILIGGANLALRGVIDYTPDIDVLAPADLLQQMQKLTGAETMQPPFYARINGADNFNVRFQTQQHGSWVTATDKLGDGHYPMSWGQLHTDRNATELVQDVRCLRLDLVEASKKALSRRKDLEHLKAIERHRAETWEESF